MIRGSPNVACFVGTGSFVIRYSDGHTKLTYRQLKKFRDYCLQNIILIINEVSKLRSSHCRNIFMVPPGTGRRSLGLLLAHCGNHSLNAFHFVIHNKIYLPEHNSRKWSPYFRFLRLKVFKINILNLSCVLHFPLIVFNGLFKKLSRLSGPYWVWCCPLGRPKCSYFWW